MRAMKADEKAHIAKIGQSKFDAALAKASMVVRMDSRLTGIDKVRDPLAWDAALFATGFERRPFSIGKKEIPPDLHAIVDDLMKKAVEAAAA